MCIEQPTKIGGSISDGISPGRGKIRLRLSLKDGSEGLILNLQNIYYLPKSPCNLVSLGLLNDSGIYHDNENKTLYEVNTRQTLAQAQRWGNSYLLKTPQPVRCCCQSPKSQQLNVSGAAERPTSNNL